MGALLEANQGSGRTVGHPETALWGISTAETLSGTVLNAWLELRQLGQAWVQLARSFGGKIGVKRCRINDKL